MLGSVRQTVTYYTFLITFFKSNAVKLLNYSPEKKINSLYSINLNLLHEILPFLLPSHWKLMNPESPFLPSLLQKHQDQLFITYVDFIFFLFTVYFLRINFQQNPSTFGACIHYTSLDKKVVVSFSFYNMNTKSAETLKRSLQ